ncbi:AbrB family transcriptional regulator [Acaryochloris marina NIES-2412]|uniref:AbrB family transcriptional regulator n=1 Tax=Acaryochloris marina TaxID=155978 RepID=UPI0040582153
MPKKTKKQSKPLIGQALLTKVKTLKDLTRQEKAKVCGYYKVSKNGTASISVMAFLNAVLDAEGMNLDAKVDSKKKLGKHTPTYRIRVQSNGILLIGNAYTKKMELQPEDEFELALGRKHIHLTQLGQE